MTWHDLLFAHWPVPAAVMRQHVPAAIDLDLWDGDAWLGVVPFTMTNVGPRGASRLPRISRFAELNVRTYVTVAGKPGVYFFSLDAANALAVAVARWRFHLPYFRAKFGVDDENDRVTYRCTRRRQPQAGFDATYKPVSKVYRAQPGSFESWLVERYCLYTTDRRGRVYRGDIHHEPWPLQRAECELRSNTMTLPLGLALPNTSPILHFAKRLDVVGWKLKDVAGG